MLTTRHLISRSAIKSKLSQLAIFDTIGQG
jgi:hypothetical protein